MILKKLLTATFLLSSTALYAENFMLVIGGGGEPPGAKTIFDESISALGDKVKSSDWKYQLSFNGGHSTTELMLKEKFPAPAAPVSKFTSDSYNKLIQDYKAKIASGQIKRGSQLMIIIDSHGAISVKEEATHKIAVSGKAATDFTKASGADLVSLDDLQGLAKLASDSGIKLAVVDLSCHSGSTQSLKKIAPNACIITATSPQHFGYTGPNSFAEKFLANLKKGETLESTFLKARAASLNAEYPMISTEENEKIVAQVYAGITPYLYYYRPKEDKLSDYIMGQSADCVTCKREQQFDKLLFMINELQSASAGRSGAYNGDELKRLIGQYKAMQDNLINSSKKLGAEKINKSEKFFTPVTYKGRPLAPIELNFTWQEIINLEPEKTMATFTRYAQTSKTEAERASNLAVVETYKKIKAKRQDIINQYPSLKTLKEDSEKIFKGIGDNRETAEKIAAEEKKLYDELYRYHQSLNTEEPCRRIVF